MKNIIAILLLALSAPSFAATNLPAASSIASGGSGAGTTAVGTPLLNVPLNAIASAGIYMLCAGINAAPTANNYFGLYSYNAPQSAGTFLIPSGKAFYGITATLMTQAGAGNFYSIGTGSGTIPLGENTATAPAGVVYFNGSATAANGSLFAMPVASITQNFSILGVTLSGGNVNGMYGWVRTSPAVAFSLCLQGIVQ